MIKKLEWDSKCFGYEIGKMEIDLPGNFNTDELPNITKGYKLVYIFSKAELSSRQANFILVDKKALLKKKTHLVFDDFNCISSFKGEVSNQLLKLAYQSGEYSRFLTDKAFIKNEFQVLYFEWIKNSVERTIADDVFVINEVEDIKGFITLSKKGTYAEIGLVAVDSEYRGQGLGTMLIGYAINWAYMNGCHEIQVFTQHQNKTAVALYEKNGFSLTDLTYIYHYRNL